MRIPNRRNAPRRRRAVSNFFATVYPAVNGQQPYVLSGDLNEDILRPPDSNPQSIQCLVSAPTGLQLTTAVNPFTDSELTISIRDGLTRRYDYILPCAMLFSNIVSSQVFRTDLLTPLPPNLFSYDDNTASDHLPVFMVFANPFNPPFRLLSLGLTNQFVSLKWESASNRAISSGSFVESGRLDAAGHQSRGDRRRFHLHDECAGRSEILPRLSRAVSVGFKESRPVPGCW